MGNGDDKDGNISFGMARPSEILATADIDRATRDAAGNLTGFQRQPVAQHIAVHLGKAGARILDPVILGSIRGKAHDEAMPPSRIQATLA